MGFTWLIAIVATVGIARVDIGVDNYIWKTFWSTFSVIAELPILSIGVLLYYLYFDGELHVIIRNNISDNKINIKVLSYVVLLCLLWRIAESIHHGASLMSYAILFGCIIWGQLVCDTKLINNKVFSGIGKYSYGIYLFHIPIINMVKVIFELYVHNMYLQVLLVVLSTIVISWTVSYILSTVVEKPMVKLVSTL